MSFILRHNPESHGITLNKEGWANLTEFVDVLAKSKYSGTLELITQVVKEDEKGRYQLDIVNNQIRAVQGHSTASVAITMQATVPPVQLFHGTGSQNHDSIRSTGIIKGNRHYVHLSDNKSTAQTVGMRHGKPLIFVVDSKRMYADGFKFFQAENGVWLTNFVPTKYLS